MALSEHQLSSVLDISSVLVPQKDQPNIKSLQDENAKLSERVEELEGSQENPWWEQRKDLTQQQQDTLRMLFFSDADPAQFANEHGQSLQDLVQVVQDALMIRLKQRARNPDVSVQPTISKGEVVRVPMAEQVIAYRPSIVQAEPVPVRRRTKAQEVQYEEQDAQVKAAAEIVRVKAAVEQFKNERTPAIVASFLVKHKSFFTEAKLPLLGEDVAETLFENMPDLVLGPTENKPNPAEERVEALKILDRVLKLSLIELSALRASVSPEAGELLMYGLGLKNEGQLLNLIAVAESERLQQFR